MPHSNATPRNILLLSGGSKVAIAKIAKKAALQRGVELHISDTSPNVPSVSVADHFTVLPHHQSPTWADELQKLCQSAQIGLVIPTRHSELLALAQCQAKLAVTQTAVALSTEQALKTCIQKIDTYRFLSSIDAPTPNSCLKRDFSGQLAFPLVAKPERGASSTGVTTLDSHEQLANVPEYWILQEKASGTEYTVNIYLSRAGKALCAIPHERIAVEAGEVTQARTRRHPELIELCAHVAEQLPGATGIINIQAFVDSSDGRICIIEINPRIGGGYPLCDAAKGHYIEWLCREYIDQKEVAPFSAWTENLLMMRYREAVFSL